MTNQDKCIVCMTVTLLTAFLAMGITQTVYGGLSINDCTIPGILSVSIGGIMTLYILYGFYSLKNTDLDNIKTKWYNFIVYILCIIVDSTVIGFLDNRDNGVCENESSLKDIAIAIIVFSSIILLINICVMVTNEQEPESPCNDQPPPAYCLSPDSLADDHSQ